MRLRLIVLAGVALTVLAVPATARADLDASARQLPLTCQIDVSRSAACAVVARYFDALNAGRAGRACNLLGVRLRSETGGSRCAEIVSASRGTPYRITGVAGGGVAGFSVVVRVGREELGTVVTDRWIASVRSEEGHLRILATRAAT